MSQDVFDTPTGKWKLIPQGSRLVGQYSSEVAYGQSRVLVAWQRIVFPDGELLGVADPHDASGEHVDTNCYVISRRAAFLAGVWGMFPTAFGSGEDRPPLQVIRQRGLKTGRLAQPTVWYESQWPVHYALAGKRPQQPVQHWHTVRHARRYLNCRRNRAVPSARNASRRAEARDASSSARAKLLYG